MAKLATEQAEALSLYNLYSEQSSNEDALESELKKLCSKKKFRPVWNAMCSLQHNQSATKLIEMHIHKQIGQKSINLDGRRYNVTLYFLPITLSTSPEIESIDMVNQLEINATLPKKLCNRIAEMIKASIKPDIGEQISILSGLVDRTLLTSYDGLAFIHGLTHRIANYCKDEDADTEIVEWLAKYDALPNIVLTPHQPEDHRALVVYTLSEANNYTLHDKFDDQSCLVNNFVGETVDVSKYNLAKSLHKVIGATYQEALSSTATNYAVVSSVLPPQTISYLRLSYFANSLIAAVDLTKQLWGGVGRCHSVSQKVSDYLTKLQLDIDTKGTAGKLQVIQVYEPFYRYDPYNELSCHIDALKHITEVEVDFMIQE